jgi:hypothetical protein
MRTTVEFFVRYTTFGGKMTAYRPQNVENPAIALRRLITGWKLENGGVGQWLGS